MAELAADWQFLPSAQPALSKAPTRGKETATSSVRQDRTALQNLTETDEALMRRYQGGSDQAFRQLYERHRGALLRFVRRLAPPESADEILQETWLAVVKGRERYRPAARFVTYLFTIAHRRTMDRWRQSGRSPAFEAIEDAADDLPAAAHYEPERGADNAALREDLNSAVEALPIPQREAFLLRAEGGLSVEEIAEVTNTTRETAKSRLRWALNRLRDALEDWT